MASKFLPPYALAAAVGSEIWSSPLKSYLHLYRYSSASTTTVTITTTF